MGFNEFDAQLQQDVHHIQVAAAQSGNDAGSQVNRVQRIGMAAAICLRTLVGPAAAAHWLREVADAFAAQANNHVH